MNFRLSICMLALILAFSCRKKNTEPLPEEETVIPPPVEQKIKRISAKVNGQDWNMCGSCWEANKLSSIDYFYFSGATAPLHPSTKILLGVPLATGTFVIPGSGAFAQYKNLSGTLFTAKTGTIVVTEFDTVGTSTYNFFKGNFSFSTDTLNGIHYTVSDGIIEFEN